MAYEKVLHPDKTDAAYPRAANQATTDSSGGHYDFLVKHACAVVSFIFTVCEEMGFVYEVKYGALELFYDYLGRELVRIEKLSVEKKSGLSSKQDELKGVEEKLKFYAIVCIQLVSKFFSSERNLMPRRAIGFLTRAEAKHILLMYEAEYNSCRKASFGEKLKKRFIHVLPKSKTGQHTQSNPVTMTDISALDGPDEFRLGGEMKNFLDDPSDDAAPFKITRENERETFDLLLLKGEKKVMGLVEGAISHQNLATCLNFLIELLSRKRNSAFEQHAGLESDELSDMMCGFNQQCYIVMDVVCKLGIHSQCFTKLGTYRSEKTKIYMRIASVVVSVASRLIYGTRKHELLCQKIVSRVYGKFLQAQYDQLLGLTGLIVEELKQSSYY